MEEIEYPVFRHPFTGIVSGPSQSGKTTFVNKFIQFSQEIISPKPSMILWCYSEWQPSYQELLQNSRVKLIEGLPDVSELKKDTHIPKLIILDDLLSVMDQKKNAITDIFIKGSHHNNCSCLLLVQNLFYNNLRTARINSHYIILMRNVSDKTQIINLAKQIFPYKNSHLLLAYEDACALPFSYLLIDLSPFSNDKLRLRTNIFPGENTIVYLDAEKGKKPGNS